MIALTAIIHIKCKIMIIIIIDCIIVSSMTSYGSIISNSSLITHGYNVEISM